VRIPLKSLPSLSDLSNLLGQTDIYLLDQLLRGRITDDMIILDAGCGSGRNLLYFLQSGHEVLGADTDAAAIDKIRKVAARLAPNLPGDNFRVEPVESMTFPDRCADLVISSAVLHFARDDAHFLAMLNGTWRALRTGGILFSRLASTIGMEGRFRPLGGRRYILPDSTERYLVDEDKLMNLTQSLGGELADPLKTTVVQNQRCMTTWVLRKC
jgi:tellurite methyltransferase